MLYRGLATRPYINELNVNWGNILSGKLAFFLRLLYNPMFLQPMERPLLAITKSSILRNLHIASLFPEATSTSFIQSMIILNTGNSASPGSTRPWVVLVCWTLPHSLFFLLCVFGWFDKLRFRPVIPLTGQCHHLVSKPSDSVSLPRSCSGTVYLLNVPTALIALQV